jgi:hypothetical protein
MPRNLALEIFIAGTVVTLLAAFILSETGHKILAAELILLSPFPCPTGLPC